LRTTQAILRGLVNKLARGQLAPLLHVGADLAQMGAQALLGTEDIIRGGALMMVPRHRDLSRL
jgi:hypothetical protein